MRPQDRERERACFEVLRRLPREGIVLIGGYALSAFGATRFSVDLDLVVTESAARRIRALLAKEGFSLEESWAAAGSSAGRAERWVRGALGSKVSVDLLIGGVADRRSGASFTYKELRARAVGRPVHGQEPTSEAEALVADREALIALKLGVGRLVDLRDVAVLAAEPADEDAIVALLQRVPRSYLLQNIERLMAAVETQAFKDSLKGVYILDDRAYARITAGARRLGLRLKARLQAAGVGTPGEPR